MRKIILSVFLGVLTLGASAQAVPDASFTDCNNNTRSVYSALGAGKVLLVANAGTNCSICMGHAGSIGTYATTNSTNVEVWGAITTKSGGNVTCTAVNNWVSSYGWNDVFSFQDMNKYWFNIAAPGFTVISPIDSAVKYTGSSWNQAQSTANAIVASLNIEEEEFISELRILPAAVELQLRTSSTGGTASLFAITGQRIENWVIEPGVTQVQLPMQPHAKGLYILKIDMGDREIVEKITL